MKRIILILLLLCLAVPVAHAGEAQPLHVVASFYPMYVAALNVMKDVPGVELTVMAPSSAGCLHEYQMSTADRRLVEDADVLILNGAGLEAFMDKLLPQLSAQIIAASDGIDLMETCYDHDHDHSHPGHTHEKNAHVWVSPDGMAAQVRNIAAGLSAADPANASLYEENANNYVAKLAALRDEISAQLAPYAGEPIVTFHEAFDYFARDFGLEIVATVVGEHGTAPSARDLADMADLIRAEHVRALFAEPQYDDTSVDILSKETGLPVYQIDPAVSGEIDPTDYDAYLRIMRENAATVAEALK